MKQVWLWKIKNHPTINQLSIFMTEKYDVIIVGAGAAGMMSAIEAGKRGRKVLLVDHAKKNRRKN